MAVCEHCNDPVTNYDKVTTINGYSYHEKCHKCYVCSETNLHDAEIFKGVIFCSSCSKRIFQGCSTARKTKENARRSRDKYDSHRRRSHRTKESEGRKSPTRIIELAGMTALSSSSRSSDNPASNTLVTNKEKAKIHGKTTNEISKSMKKSSAEMGMTTDVTQELLRQMNCPVVNERKYETYCTIQTLVRRFCTKAVPDRTGAFTTIFRDFCSRYYGVGARRRTATSKRIVFESGILRRKSGTPVKSLLKPPRGRKKPCSDLRIAELGTSTEIANMALKHRSELPVIIRSQFRKPLRSQSESLKNNESVNDRDRNVQSSGSTRSTLEDYSPWKISRMIKKPINSFKRNILDRSSLIDCLMSTNDNKPILNRIKMLFHEEINEHQKRGLKRLYSTINRQKTPHKLGWLSLIANIYCNTNRDNMFRVSRGHIHKRCKHFKSSHSYRCMRAQVMKMAGPTKSELAVFRAKVKNMVSPGVNLSSIKRRRSAIVISLACGNSPTSTKSQY